MISSLILFSEDVEKAPEVVVTESHNCETAATESPAAADQHTAAASPVKHQTEDLPVEINESTNSSVVRCLYFTDTFLING